MEKEEAVAGDVGEFKVVVDEDHTKRSSESLTLTRYDAIIAMIMGILPRIVKQRRKMKR